MQTITFLPMLLTLFDGGAAAAGAGEGAGAQGETQAAPGNTRRGKSGETILYGKQPSVATEDAATSAPAAGESTKEAQVKTTSNTLEERRKAYFDLINSEDYKDIHTQESQRMINRRFSETKNLQQQVDDFSPVKDILMQRYKVEDGDMGKLLKALENDDKYWSEAAEEQGLTVDQYKRIQQMERQLKESNLREQRMLSQQRAEQQMQKWDAEAQTLKGIYQNFDIHTEAQNPQFMSLLRSGVPM
jgi:activator of HSP90 ATPase